MQRFDYLVLAFGLKRAGNRWCNHPIFYAFDYQGFDGDKDLFGRRSIEAGLAIVQNLIMFLESRRYATRYKSNDNRELKYVFLSHEDTIVQARHFHEVMLIDTTYKTNPQGLLSTTLLASAILVLEAL
jgi:hypothetical protein